MGVAIDSIEDMRTLLDRIPLDRVSTSMTINAPAAVLLLLYQLVAERAGRRARRADRDHPERRAQGVHRPRHLHLPAGALAAAGRRHLRLLPARDARAGTPSRSPATTWPRPARRPRRRSRSRWPTRRSTCGPRSAAGLAVDDFAPRLSFFFVARTTLLEEVAKFRAARRMWARDHAGRVRRGRPALADAAVPHPDRRRAADRAAARGQPGPGHRPGARGRARRYPVAAHQLLRRGDRAARRRRRPGWRCGPSRCSPTRPT